MTQSSRVLATRCPHCHTVFRVVADQLKLRDGLVRCGHCREVFDGRAYLCDPPADDAPPTSASAGATPGQSGAVERTVATPGAASTVPTAHEGASSSSSSSSSFAAISEKPVPEMLTPTAIAALLGSPDESRAQMQHGPGRYMDDDDPTVLTAPTASPSLRAQTPPLSTDANKRPGAARVIWRVLMTLAVLAPLCQWAWIERAALVDRIPALHGVFAAIGRPLQLTVGLPRQPDKIQISSVTLVTDAVGDTSDNGNDGDVASAATASPVTASDASATASDTPTDGVPMTLTVFVRNEADHALAWPSLELTLSDIDGKPVVRRVFSANEYVTGATLRDAGLAPRNERTIRLRLSAQAALASNYRVLAFYP
ncbi:DUF3426 domain-containing protein [Pandoraea oxalativorans]|uniref:Zinc finger/thioredoxin putative domain-containing protein n=1 Tax=Pandoraea oxalativorans TaxID=573737 RepID=A0A0E3U578_9BURK|nr:DUF3426 domain-containing protein [Pandoraea oxalativorans]AKC68393.1 hypothetical protein MB84_01385 [Pandoraea oxalativorans]